MLTARQPIRSDVQFIADNLREMDALEMDTVRHEREPRANQLLRYIDGAWGCLAFIDGVTPICLFGVTCDPEKAGIAIPWMLGTPGIEKYPIHLARWGRQFIDAMSAEFPVLYNIVYSGNLKSIQWLRWCGFTVHNDVHIDMGGYDFLYFDKVNHAGES